MRRGLTFILVSFAVLGAAAPSPGQIPPGWEIIQITDDDWYDGPPSINNCGQIVFSKRLNNFHEAEEIFLWNRGILSRLTDDDVRDAHPHVQDQGVIVWNRKIAPGDLFHIVRWSGREIEVISEESTTDTFVRANSNGHAVWSTFNFEGCTGSNAAISFFDGESVQAISGALLSNQGPDIDDFDRTVWTQYNFCVAPWVSTIMYRESGSTTPLTDDNTTVQHVRINNLSHATWNDDHRILFWDGSTVGELTDSGLTPDINNFDEIVFLRWFPEVSNLHVWLWNGKEFLELTSGGNNVEHTNPAINDPGEIVWQFGVYPATDIYLLTWVVGNSDFDRNGSVDLLDLAKLIGCLSGPEERGNNCECYRVDSDRTGGVDLMDYSWLQRAFTQP